MSIEFRHAQPRGHADHGWLRARHSFSFGSYHDPRHLRFGPIVVLNEDRISPGMGFGEHAHRDMEIISYVISGALAHRDSMGNGSVLRYGDVQRMSAGRGIAHSEFNASASEEVHFLQIWMEPREKSLPASYQEQHFDAASKRGALRLIASPDGRDGSVLIHQDAWLRAAILDGADRVEYQCVAERQAYLQVARGHLRANGHQLDQGDALKIAGPCALTLDEGRDAEVLLFDVARV
ncbi:pirin family protein [Cupriavidus sp. 2TAF22]|uniref:pirin family protein n=1 Tax=unclassified Cupriavidus TaxID=2640874 RepID=UPI003F933025